MIDTDAIAKHQQSYLKALNESWAEACQQMPLLGNLSLRHGE